MEDPEDLSTLDAVKKLTKLNPEIFISSKSNIEKALKIHPDYTFPTLDELTNETSLFRNPDRKNANL